MNLDRAIKNVNHRSESDLIEKRITNAVNVPFPVEADRDSTGIVRLLNNIGTQVVQQEQKTTETIHWHSISSIGAHSLADSLVWFYKGSNAFASAISDASSGRHTWSIANWYQAAILFARSLMNFWGLVFFRTDSNVELMIDIFPDYSSIKQKLKRREAEEEHQSVCMRVKQLEHYQMWGIIKRIINTTSGIGASEYLTSRIQDDDKDFARSRNYVLYHPNKWFFSDLKQASSWSAETHQSIAMNADLDDLFRTSPALLAEHLRRLVVHWFMGMGKASGQFQTELGIILDQPNIDAAVHSDLSPLIFDTTT